ncbi:DUF998 domain-containing protein [Rhodococcus sp. NPDC058505]|uniref:DUF998 domain-containing protein n=1 Tax=unclassified Rhodococcus (in: high G+C Gram-positive bacteria) TaxID=192944 RepID=UPI0036583EB9
MTGAARVRVVVVVLLAVGAVSYTSWLLELVLPTGLDPARAYTSELAALDQPYGFWFRTADLVTGAILLTAALLAAALLPRRPLTTTGWVALGVFGIATAADSRMPLHCSAHASARCAALEAAGVYDQARLLHASTSTVAATSAAVSVFAFILAAYRYGWPGWLRWTGIAIVVGYVAGLAWTLWAVRADGHGDEVWLLGYAQRLQLLAVSGWIAYAAAVAWWQRKKVRY